jgi:hypothetical protein
MKMPVVLVPPAQAEALYDAFLLNAPRERGAPAVVPPYLQWDILEWDEDDAPQERTTPIPKASLSIFDPAFRLPAKDGQ